MASEERWRLRATGGRDVEEREDKLASLRVVGWRLRAQRGFGIRVLDGHDGDGEQRGGSSERDSGKERPGSKGLLGIMRGDRYARSRCARVWRIQSWIEW